MKMNQQELTLSKEEFMSLIDDICDVKPGTIKADDLISNANLFDSLAMLGLIVMLDKKFGLNFSLDELGNIGSVGNLFNKIVQLS